ncbi:MAG TPA: alpha/beta hydrolase-fold protein [Candidatus Eisenbacteria bacterium]|nr:alpha/beta hydrolase-fold protein [Candidatus Eisenbacteria bacterium]
MNSLALKAAFAEPEGPPAGGGLGRITHGEHAAYVLAPTTPDPDRAYPLVVVLHGAGRQDEMIARGLKDEPDRRHAVFVVPRSREMTWDLIAGGPGEDLAFLGLVLDAVYRRFRIDPARQALIGFSDGASYGLGIALSNPRIFAAVMAWAAGFLAIDAQNLRADDPKPRVFLEYGTHDQLFPFEHVALPMRDTLTRLGYPLEFRVDEGGIHWPRAGFMGDALDWFLGAAA